MRKDSLERYDYEVDEPVGEPKIPEDLRLEPQMVAPVKRHHRAFTNGLFAVIMVIDVVLLVSSLALGMQMLLTIAVILALADVTWGIWLIR